MSQAKFRTITIPPIALCCAEMLAVTDEEEKEPVEDVLQLRLCWDDASWVVAPTYVRDWVKAISELRRDPSLLQHDWGFHVHLVAEALQSLRPAFDWTTLSKALSLPESSSSSTTPAPDAKQLARAAHIGTTDKDIPDKTERSSIAKSSPLVFAPFQGRSGRRLRILKFGRSRRVPAFELSLPNPVANSPPPAATSAIPMTEETEE